MIFYIIIYIIIGLIAGFIDTKTDARMKWSYGIIIVGALVSIVTTGAFVIAAVIEMMIGFGIAIAIKEKAKKFFQIEDKSNVSAEAGTLRNTLQTTPNGVLYKQYEYKATEEINKLLTRVRTKEEEAAEDAAIAAL